MSSKKHSVLDEFGKAFVREVYDESIDVLFTTITRGMRGSKPDPLQLAYQSLDEESAAVARQLIHEAIDQTFARCLSFFDSHDIAILIKSSEGSETNVTRASDGLPAEPYGPNGWIMKFSKFRNGFPSGAQ